ncbi:MAG: radical SAM protein, partial [Flavobacteriales bacterium]|nr:radical SAM protein [Flavobacteriales bacterium]
MKDKYKYVYDLSSIWKKLTGLPFVFALWVTNKNLDNKFLSQFNLALSFGVKNIQEAISFFDY